MRVLCALAVLAASCRIETATPGADRAVAEASTPSGDVWVYTSMYRHVLDALDPVLHEALPHVTVHWFQAGSEKVTSRLEAEWAAGGTVCDVLMTSDPFLFQHYKREHRWLRYVSPNGLRTPRGLFDLDGEFAAIRVSTMVLVHRSGTAAPTSFEALTSPEFANEVVVGDPLTSGTAFTWAVQEEQQHGVGFFKRLRANGAHVGGGNASVLQKLEGREASVGVLLLENAITAKAKGSPIEVAWPSDGAVVIPGYAGILASTRNPTASKAVVDVLLSPKGQAVIATVGAMHSVDPRVAGPGDGKVGLEALMSRAAPVNEAFLERGLTDGARVKQAFTQAFSQ